MCRDFYEFQEMATAAGWYGYGTAPRCAAFLCSCGDHFVGVATESDDPLHYENASLVVMACQVEAQSA